jgi:hypothetical protein
MHHPLRIPRIWGSLESIDVCYATTHMRSQLPDVISSREMQSQTNENKLIGITYPAKPNIYPWNTWDSHAILTRCD